eukprot:SAG31_NODE_16962_length_688_cov_3.152478_1_plen_64_part_00
MSQLTAVQAIEQKTARQLASVFDDIDPEESGHITKTQLAAVVDSRARHGGVAEEYFYHACVGT